MQSSSKKKHRFPRLILKDRADYKQIELRTLKVGIWINVLMGICGWAGYYFASSIALALDGSLCVVSAVSFVIALRITRERDVSNDEYPFGIYSVENVYAMLQGILLVAITGYAILEGVGNIVGFFRGTGTAPEPLKLAPLLIYTAVMIFACTGTWLYYKIQLQRTENESPILKSETVSAFVDTFVTIGTGLALILVALVGPDSKVAFLRYIGDSLILIAISLFLIPQPLKVVSQSFFSLIGRTVQNATVRRRTEAVVLANLDTSFKLVRLLLFHIGSSYEVDVTVTPVEDSEMDLSLYRESRKAVECELRKLYPNLVLQFFLE